MYWFVIALLVIVILATHIISKHTCIHVFPQLSWIIRPKMKKLHAIQDVFSSEEIWRNLALHHLLTKWMGAVKMSPNIL